MKTIEIEPDGILAKAKEMKDSGFRLVQIHCSNPGHFELNYTYDKGYDLVNYKCVMQERIPISSISDFFPAAFLYENEIHELFGIEIRGIIIDYKGRLYVTKTPEPFTKINIQARADAKAAAAAAAAGKESLNG